MKKTIEKYISQFDSLKMSFSPSEADNDFNDGCNCAIECINDGIDTRIKILKDFEEEGITAETIHNTFGELIQSLTDSLQSCMKSEQTLFSQGFNKTVIDFCSNIK